MRHGVLGHISDRTIGRLPRRPPLGHFRGCAADRMMSPRLSSARANDMGSCDFPLRLRSFTRAAVAKGTKAPRHDLLDSAWVDRRGKHRLALRVWSSSPHKATRRFEYRETIIMIIIRVAILLQA